MNSPYTLARTPRRRRVTPYREWIFISLLFQQPPDALRHVLCGSRPHNLSLRHIFVSAAPRYDIEGKLQVGEMVLSGVEPRSGRGNSCPQMWKPARRGVRETAVTSTDGGKTWNPWFDLLLRPHKP